MEVGLAEASAFAEEIARVADLVKNWDCFVQAVVTMCASRTRARSVEISMALPFVPMTLEFRSTSRPLMQ